MISLAPFKVELAPDEPLAPHTTWRIGGKARFMVWPKNLEELLSVLTAAAEEGLPYFVLGRGSNLLVSDQGFPGIVISLSRYECDGFLREDNRVEVSAGASNAWFVRALGAQGLGGLEFLASIPGSIGGAVMQNAGFSRTQVKTQISDFVETITVCGKDGAVKTFRKADIAFSYRQSCLDPWIILRVALRCVPADKERVRSQIRENMAYRHRVQDLRFPSAGSVFKNPAGAPMSSGRMIQEAGLAGYRIGDAQISERHANFFINRGRASASHMRELIERARVEVKQKFGVTLEEEIKYLGP